MTQRSGYFQVRVHLLTSNPGPTFPFMDQGPAWDDPDMASKTAESISKNYGVQTEVVACLVDGSYETLKEFLPDTDNDCSDDCKNNVGRTKTADERWHHRDCPNHTSACCPINEDTDNER